MSQELDPETLEWLERVSAANRRMMEDEEYRKTIEERLYRTVDSPALVAARERIQAAYQASLEAEEAAQNEQAEAAEDKKKEV